MSDETLELARAGLERILRAAAFGILLETGKAASAEDVSTRMGLPIDRTRQLLGKLAAIDWIRLDGEGRVAVSGGLSAAPTPHRMSGPFGVRFTCCAYDALGILAALDADGEIESVSPESGEGIVVRFVRGAPQASDAALFLADNSCCGSTLADWCPNVNFFEDESAASRWSQRSGVAGRPVTLEEGIELAAREWRLLFGLVPRAAARAAGSVRP
jgi:alkylmercury lyase